MTVWPNYNQVSTYAASAGAGSAGAVGAGAPRVAAAAHVDFWIKVLVVLRFKSGAGSVSCDEAGGVVCGVTRVDVGRKHGYLYPSNPTWPPT